MNQRAGLGLHQLCFACTPQNATETTEHRPIKEGWIFEFGGCFGSFSLHILAISVRRLMEKESKHMVRFMKMPSGYAVQRFLCCAGMRARVGRDEGWAGFLLFAFECCVHVSTERRAPIHFNFASRTAQWGVRHNIGQRDN